MKPTELSILDLLSDRSPFLVERYQRAYAWTEEEVKEFADDLLNLNESSDTHFFGSVVSVRKEIEGTKSGFQFEVIDGQQRLATFTILFSIIEKEFAKLEARARNNKTKQDAHNSSENIRNDCLYKKYRDGSSWL